MLPNKLFTIESKDLVNKNFIYMFDANCQKEFNSFSSGMQNNFDSIFTLQKNDTELPADQQEKMDYRFMNLNNNKGNKSKKRIMEKCSRYRFVRANENKWLLEKSSSGTDKWFPVDETYDDIEARLKDMNNTIKEPNLVENEHSDFILIATSEDSQTGGKKTGRKNKKVRKHRGIIQTGGSKGKLKKGYRFSGKRLKNGMPEIVKAKKL